MKPIMLFLFGMMLISLIAAQNTESRIIPSGKSATMEMYLLRGEWATASINVTGGNERIYFTVKNSSGNIILPSAMVLRGGNFTIFASEDGTYPVIFDNAITADADKNVTLTYTTYRTTPAPPEEKTCYDWFFILSLVLAAIFVKGGIA